MEISGLAIKNYRKKMKLSQTEFGNLIGTSYRTIQNYEAGGTIPKSKHEILRGILYQTNILEEEVDTVNESEAPKYDTNHKRQGKFSDLSPKHKEALKHKFKSMLISINEIITSIELEPASVSQINKLKDAEIARAEILQFLEGLNK